MPDSQKRIERAKLERIKKVYLSTGGNVSETARIMKMKRTTVRDRLVAEGTLKQGLTKAASKPWKPQYKIEARPATTRVVIMTAAQDDTGMYPGFNNLQEYASKRGAEIFVGGFTYNKSLYTDHETRNAYFHDDVTPLLRPEIIQLAPKLVWYGDFNCLPTAPDPLMGWDTNTRDCWAVFPHAKIALKPIPVMPGRPGKQIMTTGVVTRPNYIAKNTGQKAEFHHTHGATIAEIKPDGKFFLRQIAMNNDGSFQDLDWFVRNGEVMKGPAVEAITWGDIHIEQIDPTVAMACWGYDVDAEMVVGSNSILDDLKPHHQFFHDSFDFKSRMPFTRNDPHERHMRIVEGNDSVEDMLNRTARFLHVTKRDWCKSVHVASNHNIFFDRWLKDSTAAGDAVNALIWHEINYRYHQAIKNGDLKFVPHIYALQNHRWSLSDVSFLHEGDPYTICQATQPIECGLHGHMGPRGAKGSPSNLKRIVERINAGHIHEPRILEGAYFAGTSSKLDLIYNTKGPHAWHHTFIVTYVSGKRSLVTIQDGQYRAA